MTQQTTKPKANYSALPIIVVVVLILIVVSFVFYKTGYKKGVMNEKCESPNCFKTDAQLNYFVNEDERKTFTILGFKQMEFSSYIRKEGNYFSLETRDSKGRMSYDVIVDLRANKTEVVIRNLSCYGLLDSSEWTWANCTTAWNANLTKENEKWLE